MGVWETSPFSGSSGAMSIDPLVRLLPSSVRVRAVAYAEGRVEEWRGWLSGEESACLSSFGSEKRRHEFIAGRAAARGLLGDRLDCSPAEVPLRRADDDAIDVQVPNWHVSIAHSGCHAIAAHNPSSRSP